MFLEAKREAMRHLLAAPVARLASSLVAFFFGEASVNLLVSLNMRPEPVQLVYPNITVLNPNHLAPFIPDSEASCPGTLLIVLIVVAWVCVIALNRSTLPAALDAASVFALGQTLNGMLTAWFKRYCGYFRPNYLDGCGWSSTAGECTRQFLEGRHSFPSGHASSSACAATLLTLTLLSRLRDSGAGWEDVALRLLAPLPLAVAGWVAASRVHDNWHHPADVAFGSALGAACAALICTLATAPSMSHVAPRPILSLTTARSHRELAHHENGQDGL
jgi:membrane-associated phospholipid phosphatase